MKKQTAFLTCILIFVLILGSVVSAAPREETESQLIDIQEYLWEMNEEMDSDLIS